MASLGRRAGAKAIDVVLFGWLAYQLSDAWLIWSLGPEVWDFVYYSPTTVSFISLQYFLVSGPLTFITLQTVFLRFWGATPGKLLCGLRVVRADGSSIGLWKSLKREIAEFLSFLVLGLGYLAPWGLTWHDRTSGTMVVEVEDGGPGPIARMWPRRWVGATTVGLLLALGFGIAKSAPGMYRWKESFEPAADRNIKAGARAEQNGDFHRALEDFTNAIAANPRSSLAYADRGLLYAHMGDLDRAFEDYREALEVDSTQVFAHLGRADVYRRRGRMVEALADYSAAIRLRPGWSGLVFAYRGRGAVHYRLGHFAEAAADFGRGASAGGADSPHFVGGNLHEAIQMCKVFRYKALCQVGDTTGAGREAARKEAYAALGSDVDRETDVADWLGD